MKDGRGDLFNGLLMAFAVHQSQGVSFFFLGGGALLLDFPVVKQPDMNNIEMSTANIFFIKTSYLF